MISSIFEKSELCKSCAHTKVCMKDKNICGDVFVAGNPMIFDNNELWEKYKEREAKGFPCEDYLSIANNLPSAQETSRIENALRGKSEEEQYDFLLWLMQDYGMRYTDTRAAVIEWLKGEKNED
jgi:hypothetical protein